ncbi:MAG: hypothetical protein K2X27_02185 [Candidatus Obscuribacterales bacterium]|nr:hypothetical protein [Candidatus Obscuribacterales bacterium]
MKKSSLKITGSLLNLLLFSLAFLSPAVADNDSFGANRKYVPARYEVLRSDKPQNIPALPRYQGPAKLLVSLKMPYTPGGVTYNERYVTTDSPERVIQYFQQALSSGNWQSQQCGWSINARDQNKNFCRVHVLSFDTSTAQPSTRFIIEYKEHN